MTDAITLPLFPLPTVLFPAGRMPLQIFEPRYLDMISRCMRETGSFGIVLIRRGQDARLTQETAQPDICEVGTAAAIIDFNPLPNGRLGIVVKGQQKFRVVHTRELADHLLEGTVVPLAAEAPVPLPAAFGGLAALLRELAQHPLVQRLGPEIDFEDSVSVSCRLAELLPIEPAIKQSLLELDSSDERLEALARVVDQMRG
jgi:Lon protease-like protein